MAAMRAMHLAATVVMTLMVPATLVMTLMDGVTGEGGAELPYLQCAPPQRPGELSEADRVSLRTKLVAATKQFKQMGGPWRMFKNQTVLDVGMGQGPIGVAALEAGVGTYTGLDPALCIEKQAMTHDKSVAHMTDGASCFKPCKLPRSPACTSCQRKMSSKYRLFPFTGKDMMAAYNDNNHARLVLLPGTFESIGAKQEELQRLRLLLPGTYDVATLITVTEHLPNNFEVLRGIYNWTTPGTRLYVDHHNYYSFRGHHRDPDRPSLIDKTNPYHRDHAFWKHLKPTSISYRDNNLNRVRLGDLAAAIATYFEKCKYTAIPTKELQQTRELLVRGGDQSILNDLQRRGFSRVELLVDHVHFHCERRSVPASSSDLQRRWRLHHPPTDGSYTPTALPRELRKVLAETVTSGRG
jgi:hypothetical protein